MNREILRLAIPNILSNISVPLLSTVDTALMGHISALHLGAVGVGSIIFSFVYWNFGFLRMGTTGMTAQAFGREHNEEMILVLCRAVAVAVSLAICMIVFQRPLLNAGIYLLNIPADQVSLVQEYFYIRIWAAPASIFMFAMIGWFFGMQNAIFPLIVVIFINVVNIILSYTLVKHYNLGIAGVASGSVIAEYLGLIVACVLFLIKYRYLLNHAVISKIIEWDSLRKFLSVNREIFIRTIFLTSVFGIFYSQSAKAGATVLAVNVILLQFVNWMSYGIDGFAHASESLVGKYTGAQDKVMLQKAIRYSFYWAIGMSVIYSFIYAGFQEQLVSIFTNEKDLVASALPYAKWLILFPLLATPGYIWDGIFVGLTASKEMMYTMAIAFVFFLSLLFLVGVTYGNHGLWAVMLVFMGARGFVQWIWWRRKIRSRILLEL